MKKCIIIANGQPPKKSVVRHLQKSGYETIICADGGADTALKLGIVPNVIIGDLDSISQKALDYYKDKCSIIKISRQNDTDVEKCLKHAIINKHERVILLGGTGDRLDHSFCNLGIVLKFSDKITIDMIHQKSILSIYSGFVELNTIKGETISIYGFNSRTKIKSEGLKFPINNTALPFGEKESTSNVAVKDRIKLSIKNGKVFVIRNYELLKKHGLI
jgi:thiamine pyrophosphokinase